MAANQSRCDLGPHELHRGPTVRTARLALGYMGPYRGHYIFGLLALLTASFVAMLPPFVLGRAIDNLKDALDGTGEVSTGDLVGYGAIFLGLAAVEGFMRFSSRLLVSGTSRRVEYDIRNDLAAHQMEMDQGFFLRSQTGDLMARATNDLQMVRDLLGPSLLDFCRVIVMLILGFVFLISLDMRLGLIAYAYFPVVGVILGVFGHAVETRYRRVQEQFGVLSTRVQENVSGMRTIKAYAQEGTEVASFADANREMMRRSMSWATFTAALWPLMVVATGASTILVLWFGGHAVVDGRMTLGEFVQFNSYLVLLANPLTSLGWVATAIQQGVASFRRIAAVLQAEPTIADPADPVVPATIHGAVEFHDVSFTYDDHPVLDRINLEIPAGTVIAVVGATGAGKTTLVNLLARLWDPTTGEVRIDGIDIRRLPLATLRRAIAFVPQETFLFSEALRDNISYGRPNPEPAALEHALATSQLANDIPQLTHGLDTVIGERGVTLSGGQKQRAALARAVIKDAPILVLDDALSHVDTHTEEEILRRLREHMRGRTTILIAHRTSTVASADRIVVLEGGRIVESGTHASLLERDGAYARFYRRQLLSEQIAGDDATVEKAG